MTFGPTYQSITTTIAALGVAWLALMGSGILDGKKSESSFRYVAAQAMAHPIYALVAIAGFYLAVVAFVHWREKLRTDVEQIGSLSSGLGIFESYGVIQARERANGIKRDYQNDRQYLLQFWRDFKDVYDDLPPKIQQASAARRAFGVGQPTQFVFVSWPGQVHKALVVLHDPMKPHNEFSELALQSVPTADQLRERLSPFINPTDLDLLAQRLRNIVGPLKGIGIGNATYFGEQNSSPDDSPKWCCFVICYNLADFEYVKLIKSSFGFSYN